MALTFASRFKPIFSETCSCRWRYYWNLVMMSGPEIISIFEIYLTIKETGKSPSTDPFSSMTISAYSLIRLTNFIHSWLICWKRRESLLSSLVFFNNNTVQCNQPTKLIQSKNMFSNMSSSYPFRLH